MEIIQYLKNWKIQANSNNYNFLSNNTYEGLIITLKATIEILTFLSTKHNFKYLMTARLNQDALEA